MGALIGAVVFIIGVVAGARVVKLGVKTVNHLFDEIEEKWL